MRRLHILVEGQTEEAVAERVLFLVFEERGLWVSKSILTTKRPAAGGKHRGGVSKWSMIEREVRTLLGDRSLDRLTTMIDFYGLPADAPGLGDLPDADPYARVRHVEAAIGAVIGDERFQPHLVLHETEAWVLAAGPAVARRAGRPAVADELAAVVARCGGPELVDDGPDTAPSKRLAAVWPAYDKVVDGPAVIADTGLEAILAQCPHARSWVDSLR